MGITLAFIGLNRASLSTALALAGCSPDIHLTGWDPDLATRVSADRFKVFTTVRQPSYWTWLWIWQ